MCLDGIRISSERDRGQRCRRRHRRRPLGPRSYPYRRRPRLPPRSSAVAALSLVDAFAALLSAEERIGIAPSAAPRLSGSANDDRVIEEVTQRVLARLSDQARPSILDVAERLVRDEIERIKQNR